MRRCADCGATLDAAGDCQGVACRVMGERRDDVVRDAERRQSWLADEDLPNPFYVPTHPESDPCDD